MGKARKRRVGRGPGETREDPGPGFIEAIEAAQKGAREKFVKKFGLQIQVTMEGGEMKLKPAGSDAKSEEKPQGA